MLTRISPLSLSLSLCPFAIFFFLANNYIFFSLLGFFSLILQMTLIRLEMKALSGLTLCFVSTSIRRKTIELKDTYSTDRFLCSSAGVLWLVKERGLSASDSLA